MKKVKKYKRGARVKSVQEIVDCMKYDQFFWKDHKPYHLGFILTMQLNTVRWWVAMGKLYWAEETEEWLALEERRRQRENLP